MKGMLRDFAFQPVNNAPLIFFRVVFGLLIFLEGIGAIFTGWVYDNLVKTEFTIPFIGFEWLQPLPEPGMYIWFVVMGLAGLSVMTGFYYRLGISVFTVLWTAIYLMQKTSYNNHYYLLVLLCIFMLIMPAHRRLSYDAKRNPEAFSTSCPQWCIAVFIIQMAIVYFYAGINKIYPEWLDGTTVSIFFSGKQDFFIIGPLLAHEFFQIVVAWGGVLFDLLVVPLMLFRKTRWLGFGMLVFFHLFNSAVFHIGIFPYLMIGMAVFFFPSDQVDRWFFKGKEQSLPESKPHFEFSWPDKAKNGLLLIFAIYFAFQVALPLRHHLFDSNVNWSEEGHRMAWRMMLRSKSGTGDFYIKDRNDPEAVRERTDFQDKLTTKQAARTAIRPDMTWQVAQKIHKHYKKEHDRDVSVFFEGRASLNGKPYQPLIDADADLAKIKWNHFESKEWILKLDDK